MTQIFYFPSIKKCHIGCKYFGISIPLIRDVDHLGLTTEYRIPITFSVVVLKWVESDRPVLKVLFKGRLYISQQDTTLQL